MIEVGDKAILELARVSGAGDEEDEIQVGFIIGETHVRVGVSIKNFGDMLTGKWKTDGVVRRFRKA